MGNVSTRLLAHKQQAVRGVLAEVIGADVSTGLALDFLRALHVEGLAVTMVGGDRVWWATEDPPTPAEMLGDVAGGAGRNRTGDLGSQWAPGSRAPCPSPRSIR